MFYALDVPEYATNLQLAARFGRFGIPFGSYTAGVDAVPYPDNFFDWVLFTEVLEHLTANPFDVIGELQRVLKPAGCLLISTPNQSWIYQRVRLLIGRSWWSLQEFEAERDPNKDLQYGHHWHEYTLTDLKYLLGR